MRSAVLLPVVFFAVLCCKLKAETLDNEPRVLERVFEDSKKDCAVKTIGGKCCSLPFIYLNKTYHHCTKKNHNRKWCATTPNYDKDKKWGNCQDCAVKTTKGECCSLPFIYKGKTYHHCTKKNHNRKWCATTPNYDENKKWGNCQDCAVKTTRGECCSLPFIYLGKTYHHCTKKNHNRKWCATTPNYDKDKKWGNCQDCAVKTTGGECCFLPFIYKGKTYHHCTKVAHNRNWCATTPNYDKDKKWGNCQEIPSYIPVPGGLYLGGLPEVPSTLAYNLTTNINPMATQVLVYIYITTHNIGPYRRGYYVISTTRNGLKYEQFMNIATGFPSVTINSANLWLPVDGGINSKVHIQLIYPSSKSIAHNEGISLDNCPFTGKSSGVFLLGYK